MYAQKRCPDMYQSHLFPYYNQWSLYEYVAQLAVPQFVIAITVMDQDYDDVRLKKSTYVKMLDKFKQRIKNNEAFTSGTLRKMTSESQIPSLERICPPDQRMPQASSSKDSTLPAFSYKKEALVRLFIEKLKQNSFNSINNNKITLNSINELSDKINTITYHTHYKGPKGFKPPIAIKLFIAFVTIITIVCTEFLASFQCLFQDYRTVVSNERQLVILKSILIGISILRMLSKMLFVKTILGEKIEYLGSICYCYITHSQFYLDLTMLISIVLLLVYPESIAVGVFGCCALLLNVIYFQQMNSVIDMFVINNTIKKQLFALFKLFLANFFISHIAATILIATTLLTEGSNWMIKYGISDEVWWVKYFYGLYYGATVVSTVGFGDISISNTTQAIIVTLIMLTGCIVLSYNITKVSSIIESLNLIPDKVRNQLSILDRLATVSEIDENLHHTIGEYIIHVGQIKKTFEITQRHELIQNLPFQLKQEFIQQSSKNFCAKLPFFFMLEIETKKQICEKLKTQVMSPNQYLTHKKLGLRKIIILRKGIVGLAYKKSGSRLNGKIVDSIEIKSETEHPQLLNTYLLIRGKKLMYDIVCQKYCIVALLEFDQLMASLRESERDYELFHQTYDEAIIRTNEWNRRKCDYCNSKHSLFVCPKIHYAPLRNIVFMRHQKGVGKEQKRSKFKYIREKIRYSKCSPLKFWKRWFVPFQKVFDTNIQKSQILRITKAGLKEQKEERESETSKWWEFEQMLLMKQFFHSITLNVDMIQNFKFYFHKDNANNLIEKSLIKNSKNTVSIEKIDEFE